VLSRLTVCYLHGTQTRCPPSSSACREAPVGIGPDRFDGLELDARSHAFLDPGWRHQVDTATKRPRQVLPEDRGTRKPQQADRNSTRMSTSLSSVIASRPADPKMRSEVTPRASRPGARSARRPEGLRTVAHRCDHDRRSIGQTPHHLGMRRATRQPRPTPSVATSSSSKPSTKRAGDA
jgi:hypothetical protein